MKQNDVVCPEICHIMSCFSCLSKLLLKKKKKKQRYPGFSLLYSTYYLSIPHKTIVVNVIFNFQSLILCSSLQFALASTTKAKTIHRYQLKRRKRRKEKLNFIAETQYELESSEPWVVTVCTCFFLSVQCNLYYFYLVLSSFPL